MYLTKGKVGNEKDILEDEKEDEEHEYHLLKIHIASDISLKSFLLHLPFFYLTHSALFVPLDSAGERERE